MFAFSKYSANRADRLEDFWRDFAFLGLTCYLRMAGRHEVEVRLLTLRMFVQLCAVRSPFLTGGRVGPEHVAQILWRLSPAYDTRTTDSHARITFVQSIAGLPFVSAVRAINRFLDRMLIDRPPHQAKQSKEKSDTSFAASIIHSLSVNYGWSGEEILDLPIPRIFQYLRRIQREREPEAALWNPMRDRFLARYMAKRKAWKETQRNGDKS